MNSCERILRAGKIGTLSLSAALLFSGCLSISPKEKTAWNPKRIEMKYSTPSEPGVVPQGKIETIGKWAVEDCPSPSGEHFIRATLYGEPKSGFNPISTPKIFIERRISQSGRLSLLVKMFWGFHSSESSFIARFDSGTPSAVPVNLQQGWGENATQESLSERWQIRMIMELANADTLTVSHPVSRLNARPAFNEINTFDTRDFYKVLERYPELWPSYSEAEVYGIRRPKASNVSGGDVKAAGKRDKEAERLNRERRRIALEKQRWHNRCAQYHRDKVFLRTKHPIWFKIKYFFLDHPDEPDNDRFYDPRVLDRNQHYLRTGKWEEPERKLFQNW